MLRSETSLSLTRDAAKALEVEHDRPAERARAARSAELARKFSETTADGDSCSAVGCAAVPDRAVTAVLSARRKQLG
jgi:hypothetical protein